MGSDWKCRVVLEISAGKTSLGKPRCTWEDNMKIKLKGI
jgi:hypothetical protein